jgi:hypothetical protein
MRLHVPSLCGNATQMELGTTQGAPLPGFVALKAQSDVRPVVALSYSGRTLLPPC